VINAGIGTKPKDVGVQFVAVLRGDRVNHKIAVYGPRPFLTRAYKLPQIRPNPAYLFPCFNTRLRPFVIVKRYGGKIPLQLSPINLGMTNARHSRKNKEKQCFADVIHGITPSFYYNIT
jgi:hypothetical protein